MYQRVPLPRGVVILGECSVLYERVARIMPIILEDVVSSHPSDDWSSNEVSFSPL